MDIEGKIHELGIFDRPKGMIPVKGYPDPKCSDCYGRGFNRQIIKGVATLIVPCACLGTTDQTRAREAYAKDRNEWPEKDEVRGVGDLRSAITAKRKSLAELVSLLPAEALNA